MMAVENETKLKVQAPVRQSKSLSPYKPRLGLSQKPDLAAGL